MTFDPFGDYATRGYLRNTQGADELTAKRLEHAAFRSEVGYALDSLKTKPSLSYEDVLQTHAKLFSSVYPWAGEDRTIHAPNRAIGKNGNFDLFSHPGDSRRAVETALNMASDPQTMRSKPGEVMGYLAFGHPFLDGNGRTIMTVHSELCRRAGMHIDWSQTNKEDYLNALTRELERPGKGHLDSYSKPCVRMEVQDLTQAEDQLRGLPGLGPSKQQRLGPVIVAKREVDTTVSKAEIVAACEASDKFRHIDRNLERMAAQVYRDPAQVVADIRSAALSGGDNRSVVGAPWAFLH
ncbi:MAG: Fic family protein [Rhizobiaceae bacterium]|nr:Fic family protein [Rhizobiaceae bacterium]